MASEDVIRARGTRLRIFSMWKNAEAKRAAAASIDRKDDRWLSEFQEHTIRLVRAAR